MPAINYKYDIGQTVWIINRSDATISLGVVESVKLIRYEAFHLAVTDVISYTVRIIDTDEYHIVAEPFVAENNIEARLILQQILAVRKDPGCG